MEPERLKAARQNKLHFEGRECKHEGHGKTRYTINNRCVKCTRDAANRNYAKIRAMLAAARG